MRSRKRQAAFLLAMLLAAAPGYSTSMFQVGLADLSVGAEKIVQARVTAVVQQWNTAHTVIYTYIRMNILDDLLSDTTDNEVILSQPGGKVGTLALAVSGTTTYSVGESDVLFLVRDPANPGAYQTVGMYQGKYKIYTDASNVQRVTQDTTQTVALYKRAAGAVETGNKYTLDDFKRVIIDYRTNATK
jgi:hypothetical protein